MDKIEDRESAISFVRTPRAIQNVMSVDVEDYFQVEAFADLVPRSSWDFWPCRVVESTRTILDLFDSHEVKATFFFLGWVAKRFPSLVREVQARGHELACHSFWHRPVYSLTPKEFREDALLAKETIEQAGGMQVFGYRAPSWTITNECLWALDILAELGFRYDSSIFPIRHDLYGVPGAHRLPHTISCGNGRSMREYPPATVRVAGLTLPFGGGGYLRILPFRFHELGFQQMSMKYGQPVVVYFHPWEFDPDQPRIPGKPRSTFRHYTNLSKMKGRIEKLLEQYPFCSFRYLLEQREKQKDRLIAEQLNRRAGLTTSQEEPESMALPPSVSSASAALDTSAPNLVPANNAHGPDVPQKDSMILAYHEICARPSGYLYAVTARQLENHLQILVELLNGSPTKLAPPLLTFDDGHISNYEFGLPLLEKYSQRALFFVTAGWTGVRGDFMGWSHLRELIAQGHSVASHGWSHVPLTRCLQSEARQELERSRKILQDRLGIAAESISLPHGRWNKALLRLCADVGYRRVYTSNAWMTSRQIGGLELYGRLMVRRTTDAEEYRRLLTLSPAGRLLRRTAYGVKELTRRMLGDRLYHRAWGLMAGRYDADAMR